mmetsp:Transcript_6670/g.14568  ORF Transcript_6670/g.14568 Transcript_6670/m.14568 type:complete len:355 (+) Transcript_6670:45-1109(+)
MLFRKNILAGSVVLVGCVSAFGCVPRRGMLPVGVGGRRALMSRLSLPRGPVGRLGNHLEDRIIAIRGGEVTEADGYMSTDNWFKLRYAAGAITSYILATVAACKLTTEAFLATGVFVVFQLFTIIWVRVLMTAPNIYSVKIPTTTLPDWVQVSLPDTSTPARVGRDQVVSSISELSGVRGTPLMVALRVVTALKSILGLVAIQNDIASRGRTSLFPIKTSADMVPLCFLCSAIGAFLIGHFELNLSDGLHTAGHYTGVLFIFFGSLGFGFLTQWSVLSRTMIGLEVVLAFIWDQICSRVQLTSDDIKRVTLNSKLCIGSELVLFVVMNLVLAMTMYASGANKGKLAVSPFRHSG